MIRKGLFFLVFLGVSFAFAANVDTTSFSKRRFCFKEGEKYLSFGTGLYGLNNAIGRDHPVLSNFKNAGIPPLFVRYEYAISDVIGLGGTFFFQLPAYKWNKTIEEYNYDTWLYEPKIYEEKYSGLSLGFLARANFHFATTKTSDPYVGAGIGYEVYMMKMTSDDPLVSERTPNRPLPFAAELVFGWRNYVGDNTAIYAEVGYGKMLLNLGVTIWLQ